MNYEEFTLKAQEALRDAASVAQKNDHSAVEPEHLLTALLEQEGGLVPSILEQLGIDRARLDRGVSDLMRNLPKAYGEATQTYFSPAMQKIIAKADAESKAMKDEFVASEHLFMALTVVESRVASLLKSIGITREGILSVLKSIRGSQSASDENAEEKYQVLEKYTRDLTALAKNSKLDPVIGRDEEIRRVMQVLSRRTKNNPVLIGEPGVGKTAMSKASPSASFRVMSPTVLKKRNFSRSISAHLSRVANFVENSRNGLKQSSPKSRRPRDESSSSSTSFTRLWARVQPKARWTLPTSLNLHSRAASCVRSERRRSTNIASISRKMQLSSAASNLYSARHRVSRILLRFYAGSRTAMKSIMEYVFETMRSLLPQCSPTATSHRVSFPTRR